MNLLLRQLGGAFHARAAASPLPRATDEPVALSGAAEPIRVLLLGSGVTTGWGVRTHGLALVGALQQELQGRLRLPVDVEQISEVGARLVEAPRLLADQAGRRWDVIVVAFGLSDAVALTSPKEWAQGLDRLLAQLDADLPRGPLVPIVLVGIPPTNLLGPTGVLSGVFARHADRLNLLTQRAVASNRRTSFVALPGMQDRQHRPEGSPAAYQAWARAIATRVAPVLSFRVEGSAEEPVAPDGALASAALDPTNALVRQRLQQLAAEVQQQVDADLVLINLLDDHRLWDVADSTGGRPRSIPVASTYCASTLQEDQLQVLDVQADPRFATLPQSGLHVYDSYAGVTLRDAHGTAVGTLCCFNGGTGAALHPEVLERAGRGAEAQLARLVSPVDRATLFAQRAALIDGEQPVRRLPHRPAADPAPVAAPDAEDSESTDVHRRISRRRRLRTEGRALTETAAARTVPTGRDVRLQGPNPIRVLLVGGDYAVGYGTRTRGEALDGAIARLLHTRTGRGVVVVNRSQPAVRLEQLAASLGPAGAHTFDLVVWAPTFEEGARLLLRSRWLAGLGLMLRRIETTSSASVLLLGFPALTGNQPLAVLGRARAAQINRIFRFAASRAQRAALVEPPSIVLKDVPALDGRTVYSEAATRLLPHLITALPVPDSTGAAMDDALAVLVPT